MTSCIFSYYICESDHKIEELTCRRSFGKYTVLTDARTPFDYAQGENSECAVFGFAINVLTGASDDIANEIISCCSNISDLVALEKNLGGKYLILFREGEDCFILGDATCSVPVYYQTSGACSISSNPQYIADQNHCTPDPQFQAIRNSGDVSQAMPFDVTEYREIKQLIPNHYLSVNRHRSIRFVNSDLPQKRISAKEAAALTAPMIENLCCFYLNRFHIYCPITAGRDSRVVLSFLASHDTPVECYTMRHPEHHADVQDLVLPKRICSENHFPYQQISDTVVSEKQKEEMDRILGANRYSQRTLRIALTIKERFFDGAIINGDIIGQVGKCSLHRDIPYCFATPAYFRCKLHNYSRDSKMLLKQWMEEVEKSGEKVNLFDLFSVENRLGRWAAQENLVYNTVGQVYLNIFNSRSIIYLWTAVARAERKESAIHFKLIEEKKPRLADVPFETDDSALIRLSKANGLTYLLASYAKYYIERKRFYRG